MSLIVQKFGGTSVADTKKLFIVTERILEEYNKNSKIVVVVSAQGKLTDTLIKEELEITKTPVSREHDVLVSTGEQITVAKLSMLLQDLGYNAISYLGNRIVYSSRKDEVFITKTYNKLKPIKIKGLTSKQKAPSLSVETVELFSVEESKNKNMQLETNNDVMYQNYNTFTEPSYNNNNSLRKNKLLEYLSKI